MRFVIALLVAVPLHFAMAAGEVHRHHTTTTSESGWLPSFGLTFGHMDQRGISELDGNAFGAKLIGAMYFRDSYWIADAGIGLQRFYLQDGLRPTVGVVSTSARYALADRWSLGPAADVLIGNGSAFGSTTNQTLLLGFVGYREFPMKDDQLLKIGLKYNTPVFISGQGGNFVGLTAEWAVGAGNSTVRQRYSRN